LSLARTGGPIPNNGPGSAQQCDADCPFSPGMCYWWAVTADRGDANGKWKVAMESRIMEDSPWQNV